MSAPIAPPQESPPSHPETPIHTHHCLCTNLLLATTYSLPALSRRGGPSLDHAYILPCPRLPSRLLTHTNTASDSDSASDSEEEEKDQGTTANPGKEPRGFTLLLSVSLPARQAPVLVRREDGFEKRWLLRCGRCRLVVGYRLDWNQFAEGGAGGEEVGKRGRRDDVLYLLPGAVMTTEDMKAGKGVLEEEVEFGLVEG